MNTIKIVLAGPSSSGKSSILNRYIDEDFKPQYNYTVGVEFRYKLLKNKNNYTKLHIWDTSGVKCFRDIIKLYYRDANIVLFVFDLNNPTSINECFEIINSSSDLRPDVQQYLIGNKMDLVNNYSLTEDIIELCNKKKINFIQCSAKTGYNIKDIFKTIIHSYNSANLYINSENCSLRSEYFKIKC